ncbi:hypothetical protein JOJ86_001481 [Rhodococcus percolatus]|nr:hypothetical protein [Rhodococcus opacus]MBP2203755.1 hypothetical protein [Rhodococcus opacus]
MTGGGDAGGNAYRVAYERGRAESRVIGAVNPYLPAEVGTPQMWLAQCWNRGRVADMPASFDVD